MKILYILPHCSTGGMPQYVLKLVEEKSKEHSVEVVEMDNFSNEYVVQRNKIKDIVPLHQLYGNQIALVELIQRFDIIHFQELPESFIGVEVLNKLYKKGRTYKIYVTTHNSYADPTTIRFTADKFILVSEWSRKKFEQVFPDICDIWEYPVEKNEYDKKTAKRHLGWDLSYKHILHVGLFASGKNQKELIEIAKLCTSEKILFHFVGNQAINFKDYWEPLMADLPSNCIIHGEVSNTQDYFKAADLFYFPSIFELNPIAVKEAFSYGLPVMLRKLYTYENMYDDMATYLTDDIYKNKKLLFGVLSIKNDDKIIVHFIEYPTVLIEGDSDIKYVVKFIDENGYCHYETTINTNSWARANRRYFTKWNIEVWKDDLLVYKNTLDYTGKRVLIGMESSALGDTLAWMPYVEEFRKKHKCHVICSTFKNNLFADSYPEIEFIEPGEVANNIDGLYRIGWYYNNGEPDLFRNSSDFRKIPLQKTAADILGIDYQELRPKLKLPERSIKKQVSIAIHGTAQTKYWNNLTGWQEVVDYLKSKGYEVILISKEEDGYMGNKHPEGVTKLPEGTLDDVIKTLRESEFFIGIGSGLSWLAWACEVPVYLISGFTEPYTETISNTIRIDAPEGACRGCFNRFRLNAGDWNWCPEHKGTERQFECSKLITAQTVISRLSVK